MARDVKEKLFEIDSKKIELDFLKKQFLVECKRHTAQCIKGKVRAAISSNPQKALDLGIAGLTPIKNQVNQIIDTISDLVEAIIDKKDIWLHSIETLLVKNFPKDHYATNGNLGPAILDSALKKLLSPIGKMLLDHDLDTARNWEQTSDAVLYRHPLDWSREMRHCIEQYNERFNELSKLVEEYEALSEQCTGNDALDLWDSI